MLRRMVTVLRSGTHSAAARVQLTRKLSGGVLFRVRRGQRKYSRCCREQFGRAAVRREFSVLRRAADRGGVTWLDTAVRWRRLWAVTRRLRLQPTRMISPLARSGLSGRDDGMRALVWRAGRICEACAQQQDTEYREPECVDNEPTTLFRTSGGCRVACLDCGVGWRW